VDQPQYADPVRHAQHDVHTGSVPLYAIPAERGGSRPAEAEAKRRSTAEPSLPPAEAGPQAAPPPVITSPELRRSMDQLDQAIRELQERAR
jgi:hypothetical protein